MVLALTWTWTTAGCSGTTDCFQIHPGNRVAITVNALDYTPANAPSGACGFGFDITQGLKLVATDLGNADTASLEGSTCNSAAVAIEPFAAWTWTATASLGGGTAPIVLGGNFNATNGTCTGKSSINVVAESGQPFAPADAGRGPVVMDRTFTTQGDGGAGCPSICFDSFSVTLERL